MAITVGIVEDRVFWPALYLVLRTGADHILHQTYALPQFNPLLAKSMVMQGGLFGAGDDAQTDQIADMLIKLGQLSHDLRTLHPRQVTIAGKRRVDRHGAIPCS